MSGRRSVSWWLVVLSLPLLCSCGFKLRGTWPWPVSQPRLHLAGLGEEHPLYAELQSLLQARQIQLVASDAPVLRIERIEEREQVLAWANDGLPVRLLLQTRLQATGRVASASATFDAQSGRELALFSNHDLSNQNEKERLKAENWKALAHQLLLQMGVWLEQQSGARIADR